MCRLERIARGLPHGSRGAGLIVWGLVAWRSLSRVVGSVTADLFLKANLAEKGDFKHVFDACALLYTCVLIYALFLHVGLPETWLRCGCAWPRLWAKQDCPAPLPSAVYSMLHACPVSCEDYPNLHGSLKNWAEARTSTKSRDSFIRTKHWERLTSFDREPFLAS